MALAAIACARARARAAGEDGGVWAAGDGPDGGPDTEPVARMIARKRLDRVLYLGDVDDGGTAKEYRRK